MLWAGSVPTMLWLQRWNFIERARLEREIWDAFERGEDIDTLVEALQNSIAQAAAGDRRDTPAAFRLEVWQATRIRIRRIEALMRGKTPPPPQP